MCTHIHSLTQPYMTYFRSVFPHCQKPPGTTVLELLYASSIYELGPCSGGLIHTGPLQLGSGNIFHVLFVKEYVRISRELSYNAQHWNAESLATYASQLQFQVFFAKLIQALHYCQCLPKYSLPIILLVFKGSLSTGISCFISKLMINDRLLKV